MDAAGREPAHGTPGARDRDADLRAQHPGRPVDRGRAGAAASRRRGGGAARRRVLGDGRLHPGGRRAGPAGGLPLGAGDAGPARAGRARAHASGRRGRPQRGRAPEAVEAVRAGEADVALTFRYEHEDLPADLTALALAVEPVRLVVPRSRLMLGGRVADPHGLRTLDGLREAVWAAGCERCRAHLLRICASAGFTPRVRHTTDDYVVVQALVAQGLAVAALPESSLDAHHHPDVLALDVPGLGARTIDAVTLPGVERVPAVAAVLGALAGAS
ncbi:LysR substrate-binding domain-containing protein [Propioniciclava coleopterorum]|uniref:LysR substrate-binding domain-containing protein n=1 Tax=Propioniciclava coleopterorum TaxID=2714937 RepID=UPI001FE46B72|nr:LysR substrate-binding domain-containing protein [Propioniciclava coleopterorum]